MDEDQQTQRIDALTESSESEFVSFQDHVNREIQRHTQHLQAELELRTWEKSQAENKLGEMTDQFNRSQAVISRAQEAYSQAQQTIIDLQRQVNAHLQAQGAGQGGIPPTPGTTTVQNIIQRKSDDKISKLRFSKTLLHSEARRVGFL